MATIEDQLNELEAAISWCIRHGAIVDFSAPEVGVSIRVRGQTFLEKTFLDAIWEAIPGGEDESP